MFTIRSSQRLVNASFLHSSSQRSFLPTNRDTALRRFLSYRVAIVGSGPSGCYTAKYIKSALDKKNIPDNTIDIIERLPTPYGLVRYGVAPDHPEVKNVQNDFDTLFEKGGIRFYGNVQVGRDVSVQELRQLYDVVVLAYGCESDRKLGIPGQDLDGVLSAREFVAWYNGHPNYLHIGAQVARAIGNDTPDGIRQASVVIIGQGNVALDCARILAKGKPGLYDTDLAAHALPVLGGGVSNVTIIGRRGHIQGAFTIKELRELVKLEKEGYGAFFLVRTDELDMGTTPASLEELSGQGGRPKKRIDKLLRETALANTNSESSKLVKLRFLVSPVRFDPSETDSSVLGSVVCERTRLEGEPGQQKAVGTGEFETISAQLALVSIGYKGVSLPGTEQWFDEGRGIMINKHGRIEQPASDLGGLYASGWLKRGPTGIIGTNITDAKEVVSTIMNDLDGHESSAENADLGSLLESRGIDVVDWDGYRRIEQAESLERRSEQQPREKITDIKRQLELAASI